MNILIVEPEINGHHLVMYVRFLIRGLAKNNINFSILTSKKIKRHPAFKILKKEKKNIKYLFLEDLKYPKNKSLISLLLFQFSNYKKIKEGYEKISKKYIFDHIFLTTIDHIDKVIPFLGSPFGDKKFSSIILNPKNHLNEYKLAKYNFKKFFYDFVINNILKQDCLEYLYSNDPLFTEYSKKKFFKYKDKIYHFNEPVEINNLKNKKKVKKNLNFRNKDFIILVYGAIKNSKSIFDLVEVLTHKNLNKDIKVLLSGKQTDEVKKFLKSKNCINLINQKRLVIMNKFLSINEEEKVFSISDLIWIVYKNSSLGSSGVLFLAKKARIPIITSKFGIPYWLNKKYKLGPSVELNDKKNIIKILNKLSDRKNFYQKYKENIHKRSNINFVRNFYLMILDNLKLLKYSKNKN